jgi:hypothetical protein
VNTFSRLLIDAEFRRILRNEPPPQERKCPVCGTGICIAELTAEEIAAGYVIIEHERFK